MKRIFLLILACVFTIGAFAQEADLSKLRAGVGLVYASEIENVGLNLNGVYAFTDQWEGEFAFTHIFKKNYVSFNVIDLNAHYVFYQPDDKTNIYGLGGLAINFVKLEDFGLGLVPDKSYTDTQLGFNLGVGLNYKIAEQLNLAPQIQYTIMDGSYLRIGISVQYLF
ncbi:outer membrane beta-barrel protein [Mangrovibacterium lignilyticum]|uniref:outer membrane beta-barrel protein n=1 Tax=Mangrovibacterium lignilyticum TaxID=2668052 RepID=UPI0013D60F27|nr:outer membrane beta-barrel protein [Mangrovibacterium lignilyticum]